MSMSVVTSLISTLKLRFTVLML